VYTRCIRRYIVIVQIFDEHSPRFWFIKICLPGQPENSSPPIYYIRRWLVYACSAYITHIIIIITATAHWAARIMRVVRLYTLCIIFRIVDIYPYIYSIYTHNIFTLYSHAHTQSDRLMSANSLSPRPRCELIEFYGRYHLPPAGGPGFTPKFATRTTTATILYHIYIFIIYTLAAHYTLIIFCPGAHR